MWLSAVERGTSMPSACMWNRNCAKCVACAATPSHFLRTFLRVRNSIEIVPHTRSHKHTHLTPFHRNLHCGFFLFRIFLGVKVVGPVLTGLGEFRSTLTPVRVSPFIRQYQFCKCIDEASNKMNFNGFAFDVLFRTRISNMQIEQLRLCLSLSLSSTAVFCLQHLLHVFVL